MKRLFTRGMAIVWGALALALAFTLVSWRHATDSADREAEQHFRFESQQVRDAIRERMTEYEQVLRGAAALFAASVSVERHQWKSYVDALHVERRFPGVQGIGFARVVAPRDREAHIRAVRAEGFSDYTIHPAGERTEYTSVVYLEPFAGRNLRAFGYDMFAEPVRRAAMERARDTGKAALSGKVTLLQETGQDVQAGCLLYFPVYRNGAPRATREERRVALAGYVYAPFRMKDLMAGILDLRPGHLDLELYDGDDASLAALMHDDARHGEAPARFVRDMPLEASGRTWTLRLSSTPAFEAEVADPTPRLILGGGVAVSLLVFLFIAATVTARETDLRARNILDSALDAIVIIDGDGRVVEFNPSAARVFGYRRDQALGRELADLVIPPAYREAHRRGLARQRESGASQIMGRILELRALRADGSEFPVELTVVPVTGIEPPLFAGFMRDISERERVEESLRATKSRLQDLLAVSPAVIYAARTQGDYGATFVSANIREQLGYAPEDFLGDSGFWANHIHPEDRDWVLTHQQLLFTEGRIRAEYRFRHRDGSWRWMDDVTVLVRDAAGEPLELVGSWFDVTPRHRAEEALQESEVRHRAVVESALDAIVVNDETGRITEFNPAAERIFGLRRDEALGKDLAELLIPAGDGGIRRQRFRESLACGIPEFGSDRVEVPALHADGHEILVELAVQRIDRGGRMFFVGFARDITARKQAEDALRRSEARLRQLLAATPAVIWASRAEGDYARIFVSENVRQVFGYSPEDFTSEPGFWADRIHPEDRPGLFAQLPREIAANKFSHEYRFRHANGEWRWVRADATVARDAAGRPEQIVGYWIDVTARVAAERDAAHARQRLRQLLSVSPAMIYAVGVDGQSGATFISDNVREQLGYAPGELLGDPEFWPKHLHPEDRERMLALKQRLVQDGRGRAEYRFRHKDGSWRWMHDETVLVRDASGAPREAVGAWLDISDRKTAELALAESGRRQAALLDSIPDLAWLKDAESRFIAANEPFARACGRRVEELPGLNDLDIWPRELAERYRADDAEVMRSARPKRAEEPLAGAGRERTWIETVKVPIFGEDGRVAGTAGIARDITERKTLAEELERSRERLRLALEASGAALWDADPASGEVYLSERWAEMLGAPPGPTRTTVRELLALADPEERQTLLAAIIPVLKGERSSYREEHRVRAARGDWRWVLSVGTVSQRLPDGRAARVSGINLDITERKRVEEALRESEERFRVMFEEAPQAIVMVDAGGAITLANAQAEKMFGYRRDELIGCGVETLVPEHFRAEHARLRAGFAGAPEARPMGRGRYLFARRKDGSELPVEVGLSPVRTGGQSYVLVSVVDITDLRRAQHATEQALRAKTEFMNSVTHELRTPLNSVIGFAELLQDQVPGPLNARQAGFVADIHASGLHLLKLVGGILEMSRLDAAGAALERERVDIGAVLAERAATHREAAEARRVAIELDVAPDTGSADLDPRALRRMVDALIDNAIKFNRGGGTVRVGAHRADGTLEIAVADSGIGIAPADLPKLFQPLVQLDATLARNYGGIGLGLTLAKRLAEQHGGTIEVISEPGKGSTFTLRLPLQEQS